MTIFEFRLDKHTPCHELRLRWEWYFPIVVRTALYVCCMSRYRLTYTKESLDFGKMKKRIRPTQVQKQPKIC